MSTYAETKKYIDSVRSKNEVMFRMALSHLMDVGIRHLTEANIQHTCEEIMQQDERNAFMTNAYMCDLVKMAGRLANINHIELLYYIAHEVHFDVGDSAISYSRAMELLGNCLNYCIADTYETDVALEMAREIGFEDDEIEQLGHGYMLDIERDDEE